MAIISRAVLGNGCILKMKRKNQRTLELIFARPVSSTLPWHGSTSKLCSQSLGERSERGQAVVLPLCSLTKSRSFTGPILHQTRIKELLLRSANGLRNTESPHESHAC